MNKEKEFEEYKLHLVNKIKAKKELPIEKLQSMEHFEGYQKALQEILDEL